MTLYAVVAGGRPTTQMITHNMQHAISYGNRLLILHQGKVLPARSAQIVFSLCSG